jgi:hypothetical protein
VGGLKDNAKVTAEAQPDMSHLHHSLTLKSLHNRFLTTFLRHIFSPFSRYVDFRVNDCKSYDLNNHRNDKGDCDASPILPYW